MAVTLQAEYYYIDGVQQSSPSYGWAGYNTSNKKYYVSVGKYYTDSYISAPTYALYTGGTDGTNSSKQLGVYFVTCSSSSTPNSTIITEPTYIANNHQTRIRFGYTYYASNGSFSGYNNTYWGYGQTTSSLIIPPGYFFVYIGTAQATSNTYSSHYTINSKHYPAKLTYTVPTFTITYNANGGSGSTASQSVTAGESVNLQNNGFMPPTEAVHGITLKDSDGTTLDASTYSSFYSNAFYRWNINGSYHKAGDAYTPSGNVTAWATWSTYYTLKKVTKSPTTTTGFTITYNPNGGTCSTTSETMTDTTTYEHIKWVSGTSEYDPTITLGGPAAYTFTVKYSSTTTKGSTTLPTPTNETTSTLKITFNYQGGSGSPVSANSTKTITKAFKGWATSSAATTGFIGSYEPDESRTLFAIWGTSTTKYSTIDLPTPTKTGYKFMGWASSASATEGSFDSYIPSSDSITTLYAIWEANGNVRIYINSTDKYKMAMVYVYAPTSTSDAKPWKLVIPYLYTSGTQPWKIIAG